jgi:hypothetical protein
MPVQGQIAWFAEVTTTNGISTLGITLTVDTNNSTAVMVTVDDGVVGDVVLYASYSSSNNVLIASQPMLVVSKPPGTVMDAIQLVPSSITLSIGDSMHPTIWAHYTNGMKCRVYIPIGQASFASSDTNVVSVGSDGTITLCSFGNAIISASYKGFTTQMAISSVVPEVRNLTGSVATNGIFQLSYMGTYMMTNMIQASTDLSNWVPLVTLRNTNGFVQYTDSESSTLQRRFYRVLIK